MKEKTIQEEVNKIITQYGNSEMCHYKIQLLFDERLKKSQPQKLYDKDLNEVEKPVLVEDESTEDDLGCVSAYRWQQYGKKLQEYQQAKPLIEQARVIKEERDRLKANELQCEKECNLRS